MERGDYLVVRGANLDRGAPRSLIEPYVRGKKLAFPILLDPDMATAQAWRVTGLPATFLVKRSGEVAGMAQGLREWDSREIQALRTLVGDEAGSTLVRVSIQVSPPGHATPISQPIQPVGFQPLPAV